MTVSMRVVVVWGVRVGVGSPSGYFRLKLVPMWRPKLMMAGRQTQG